MRRILKTLFKIVMIGVPFACIIVGSVIYFVRANGLGFNTEKKRGILEECRELQIPDLSYTDVLGDPCNCMTPQGICIAGDYILITAYCNIDSLKEVLENNSDQTVNQMRIEATEEHNRHNSVLYVIDKANGNHIATMVFDDKSHVGGITFDGEYIWVAKGGNCKIDGYSFVDVRACIEIGSFNYPMCETACEVKCDNVTSFVTYYDGYIWVGTFSDDTSMNGVLTGYNIVKEGGIHCVETREIVEIPAHANGAAFIDTEVGPYLAVTTSYGRSNDSTLYVYDATNLRSAGVIGKTKLPEYAKFVLPPMAEELCVENNDIYNFIDTISSLPSEEEKPAGSPEGRLRKG